MQTFHFDLSTKSIAPVLNAKQGDVGRKFKAVITDGGAAYNIPAGAQFSVWFSGPSGEGNYSAIGERTAFTVDSNTVTVELLAQMLVNAGTGAMCLVLSGNDGTQLGLWNVIYAVEHVPGMGSEAAEGYYTALSELAKQAIDAATTFKTDPSLSVGGRAADAAAVGAQLAAKAPAGYGLGEEIPSVTDLDTVTKSGNYKGNVKLPGSTVGAIVWCRADMSSAYYGTQHCYTELNGGGELSRTKNNGVWGEWEWVNPPMVYGVEFRTTERWNGKVVYAKAINIGALPNATKATYDSIATGVADVVGYNLTIFGANGDSYANNNLVYEIGQSGGGTMWAQIKTDLNLSGYTGTISVKYTKE